MDCRLLCPWDSPCKSTGVGCHFLLQGIFPTQGLNLMSLMSPALAGRFFTPSTTWEAHLHVEKYTNHKYTVHIFFKKTEHSCNQHLDQETKYIIPILHYLSRDKPLSWLYNCLFLKCIQMKSFATYSFLTGFFPLKCYLCEMPLHGALVCSFSLLWNLTLNEYTTTHFPF